MRWRLRRFVCVCVCVCEREREREDSGRDSEGGLGWRMSNGDGAEALDRGESWDMGGRGRRAACNGGKAGAGGAPE